MTSTALAAELDADHELVERLCSGARIPALWRSLGERALRVTRWLELPAEPPAVFDEERVARLSQRLEAYTAKFDPSVEPEVALSELRTRAARFNQHA
jgi:hypothetical protein